MASYSINVKQDLAESMQRHILKTPLVRNNQYAHVFNVEVTNNGVPYPVGSVEANFVQSNGVTVPLDSAYCSSSGNVATVRLPQACYTMPGRAILVINCESDGGITCIAWFDCTVLNGSTENALDPGTIIPSVETLIDRIDDAVESIPADYSQLLASISDNFSAETPWAAGAYVWGPSNATHPGALYRFTSAHSGSWVETDATLVVIGNELNDTVRYTPQVHTDAEKAIARTNIGAASAAEVGNVPANTTVENQISDLGIAVSTNASDIDGLQHQVGNVPTGETVEGQIGDLKSAIDSVYTGNYTNLMTLTGPVLLGNYSIGDVVDITPLNERPATSQAHYTILIKNVDVNERFFLQLTDGRTARPWAFLDADYKLLSVNADAYANDITIIAPAETKYLLLQCGQAHYSNAVIKRYRALRNHLANGAIGLPNNKKINITDTTITFPSMTRFFYGNGATYRISSTTTIQRAATPDSEYSEELVIFSPSTSTLSCVGGNSFGSTQDDDILLFTLSPADNSCSLSHTMYTYNGTSLFYQKTKVNYIGLPNERKISITDTAIDIPSLTRIFYGEGLTHRLSRTIVQRVATPTGSYSEELVVFDRNTLTIRCVGGSEFNTLSESDIVLFVLSKGNNGCTLPATMYTYNSESVYQKTKTGILKFVDDEKIINLLENLSNVARNDTSTAIKNRNHLLNLLYFSDIHGSMANIQRILDFYEAYEGYLFDVIHCGDSVSVHYEDANPFATVGGDTILNVIGNHEAWKTGATWPTPYNATASECYEKFIAPYISNWGVESAGENLCYYYKDYATNNIRLIILDAIHWDSAQKTWLIDTLAAAKTLGYAVVIASHYPPQKGITGFACTFNSITQTIDEVIPGERQMERLPDDAYDVVDDFINDGGNFACWLNGHTHDDFIGTVNSHNSQIAIVISCALTSNKYSECARTGGTAIQDLFNIFSMDSNAKLIKLIRIGADHDKFLRSRKTLCINYDTKQIVSNT